jgi:septal ring factor EnvC (AmiA/AmiB activator)
MMKSNTSGPNRLSRVAAKEVPHRADERLFAAKADVKKACEDLLHDLRHSSAHAPMVADLVTAVNRVQQQLKDITPDEPKASSSVKDMAKEVQHLQVAETWVSATERVLTRLGSNVTHEMRDALLESQDTVMWCVRAQHWDGELTAATKQLEKLVKDAEALAPNR